MPKSCFCYFMKIFSELRLFNSRFCFESFEKSVATLDLMTILKTQNTGKLQIKMTVQLDCAE